MAETCRTAYSNTLQNCGCNWPLLFPPPTNLFYSLYIFLCIQVRTALRWLEFCTLGATALSRPGSALYRDFTIILRHTTLCRTHLDEWSARSRDLLPDNTQHSIETDLHAPPFHWDSNPQSQQANVDPHLTRRGYWGLMRRVYKSRNM